MNRAELNKILENHKHWINKDCEGWEDMRADLSGADLYGANLYQVNLSGANLYKANLFRANLSGANLYKANLSRANLTRADLYKANLTGTNLYGASLIEAKSVPFIPMVCPEEGSFIGYKKADNLIVKLEICEDARRSSATERKCRCDKAKVLSITNLDGTESSVTEVVSRFDRTFKYKVGEIVEEPNFCEDRFEECARGIHFFINRQEAVEY